MLDALATIVQLMGVMAALAILGEPMRLFLARMSAMLRNLDFVEICVLDVYLGGLLLYAIALPSLHLLDLPIVISLVLLFGAISLVYYYRSKGRDAFSIRGIIAHQDRNRMLDQTFVLGMFALTICILIFPLSSLVYGSILDTSFHSLSVQVILENKYIPYNLEPYLPEGIIYPQAGHTIFAFATYVTGWIAPKAVFYVTQLFNAITILGAYFLARRLWLNRAFYLGVVFVFTFVASWPMFITWGANPFVVGFGLFMVGLGIIFDLFFFSGGESKKELFILGILFGYMGAIMISFLQTLVAVAILGLIVMLRIRPLKAKRLVSRFVFIFAVSMLPLSPFLFRFASYYPYPGHNVGLPADFAGYPKVQHWLTQGLQWTFENLSPYFSLSVLMTVICIISGMLFLKTDRSSGLKRASSAALLIFVTSVSLGLLAYVLPPDFNVLSWGHQGIILVIGISLFVAIFNHTLFNFVRGFVSKLLPNEARKPRVALLASILILSAVYAPFVYSRLIVDPSTLRGAYSMFSVTSEDDAKLMLWIKENLTQDAVILVNQYEPGTFIPAVANRKAVFATPGSQLSQSYQELIGLLTNETLSTSCYDIMKNLGITHVYIGSRATYQWVQNHKWNPQLILGNPNFELVKRVRDAYLFKVLYEDSSQVFRDDFEHEKWSEYGWQTYFDGNGLGNVTLADAFVNQSQKSLRITAQAVYTVSTWKYTRYVLKQIFVQNDSDVSLSFYLNASSGFHGEDDLAVLISNIYHNESIVFAMPDGIYRSYVNSILLGGYEGFFEFKGNRSLSALWRQLHKEPLPNTFMLELVNYDFDGIENVAYVDNIAVTSRPTA